MTTAISAPSRVTCVNRRATREQRDSLSRTAVGAQGSQLGIGAVQIAGVVEIAEGVIAAQVVAFRGQWAAAVSSRIVRDNAVLDGRRAIVRDAAAAIASS